MHGEELPSCLYSHVNGPAYDHGLNDHRGHAYDPNGCGLHGYGLHGYGPNGCDPNGYDLHGYDLHDCVLICDCAIRKCVYGFLFPALTSNNNYESVHDPMCNPSPFHHGYQSYPNRYDRDHD